MVDEITELDEEPPPSPSGLADNDIMLVGDKCQQGLGLEDSKEIEQRGSGEIDYKDVLQFFVEGKGDTGLDDMLAADFVGENFFPECGLCIEEESEELGMLYSWMARSKYLKFGNHRIQELFYDYELHSSGWEREFVQDSVRRAGESVNNLAKLVAKIRKGPLLPDFSLKVFFEEEDAFGKDIKTDLDKYEKEVDILV